MCKSSIMYACFTIHGINDAGSRRETNRKESCQLKGIIKSTEFA